jgi:hypothetical protein
MAAAQIIVAGAELYGAIGLAVAVGFVLAGIARAMPGAGHVTCGGRLILLPGAAVLWPWALRRWLKGGAQP